MTLRHSYPTSINAMCTVIAEAQVAKLHGNI